MAHNEDIEIVTEPTTDLRLFGAGLAWQAFWSDAPDKVSYGRDEHNARDWLDLQHPRTAAARP